MNAFATVSDLMVFSNLTEEQQTTATTLLEVVSDRLRFEAEKVGKNIDEMAGESEIYANVVKSVTVGIVERTLKLMKDESPIVTQFSESAMGYSYSGTIPNAGESLYIKNNELKALGLRKQRIGGIELG